MLAYLMGTSIANQVSRAITSVERKRKKSQSRDSRMQQDAGDDDNKSASSRNTLA